MMSSSIPVIWSIGVITISPVFYADTKLVTSVATIHPIILLFMIFLALTLQSYYMISILDPMFMERYRAINLCILYSTAAIALPLIIGALKISIWNNDLSTKQYIFMNYTNLNLILALILVSTCTRYICDYIAFLLKMYNRDYRVFRIARSEIVKKVESFKASYSLKNMYVDEQKIDCVKYLFEKLNIAFKDLDENNKRTRDPIEKRIIKIVTDDLAVLIKFFSAFISSNEIVVWYDFIDFIEGKSIDGRPLARQAILAYTHLKREENS
jgi:hypothetical protein